MPASVSTHAPDLTPWGKTDTVTERLPGVFQVTTPSHGGFILSEDRQAAMPDALRLDAPAYEEDVHWSLVVLAFAAELRTAGDHLTRFEIELAHQTARNWMPERYAAFTGKPVEPRDSYILRSIRAHEDLIGEIVVVSAFGDWADWVPAGKTGVIGRKLASVDHLGHPTYEGPEHRALVEAASYKASASPNSFAAIGAVVIE